MEKSSVIWEKIFICVRMYIFHQREVKYNKMTFNIKLMNNQFINIFYYVLFHFKIF